MSDTTNTNSPVAPVAKIDRQTGKKVLSDKKATVAKSAPTAITRRKLGPDEKLTRKDKQMHVDVEAKTVKTTYTFKLSENDPNVWVADSVFDFSNCTMAEILEMATSSARINAQSLLRKMPNNLQLNANTFKHIDVKSVIVDTVRTPVDPDTRAIRSLASANLSAVVDGMTDEQAAALLAQLNARKSA